MVEPSRLAETCTPSSIWPDAEVIEPVSNWSAEAVLAAPTRTRLATLANNWPRISVMVFSSLRVTQQCSLPLVDKGTPERETREGPSWRNPNIAGLRQPTVVRAFRRCRATLRPTPDAYHVLASISLNASRARRNASTPHGTPA